MPATAVAATAVSMLCGELPDRSVLYIVQEINCITILQNWDNSCDGLKWLFSYREVLEIHF